MNNVIHVKLEYDQALEAKKDLLKLESSMIKIAKRMRNFHALRGEEIKLKNRLKNSIDDSKKDIRKIEAIWPRDSFSEIEQFEEKISHGFVEDKKEARYNADLEMQLREIQEKLNSLGR